MATLYTKCGQPVLIDYEDLHLVFGRTPRLHKSFKANVCHVVYGASTLVHRVIMNPDPDQFVDHINMNGLDNRRCNLRIATKSQNMMNTTKRRDNKTGYKGVHLFKATCL